MYEFNGYIMVYWYVLDFGDVFLVQVVFVWGIVVSGYFICVGMWLGWVLVFDILVKGFNIVLSEELVGYQMLIIDIVIEFVQGQDCVVDMVMVDDLGLLCVWWLGLEFILLICILGFGVLCFFVQLWQGIIVVGYGNG